MKHGITKILSIAAFILALGVGAASADDGWGKRRGHGWGHSRHKVVHHHYHPAPRPVTCVRHVVHHRPVVVERHYYPPVRYVQPSGFVFGMSFVDAVNGAAFSFGVGGR